MSDRRSYYSPSRYNDDLTLKTPWSLWLILIYGLRQALFILLGFLPTTADTLDYLLESVEPPFLLVNAMAAAVMVAAFRRRGQAGQAIRRIWSSGRWLLITALSLDILLSIVFGWPTLTNVGSDRGLLVVVQVTLGALMLTYLFRSRLVRDVFRSFPDG